MPTYEIITLVDITRTRARRDEVDLIKRSQQANFDSLRQAIELRSNVDWNDDPKKYNGVLPPETADGKASYWRWQFFVEREVVFESNGDPVALLKQDLNGVPIIDGLEDTAKLDPPAIITQGQNINTWVNVIT
jgi:hypothetical protein